MPIGQLIRLTVQPEFMDGVLAMNRPNVAGSRQEPGCLRFDMARDADDPTVLWVWEVFTDQAALEAHWRSPHFLTWKQWLSTLPDGAVLRQRFSLLPVEP